MKALRWYGRKDVRYEDMPEPSPGPGQLKVKVNLAGICGTDLKEYSDGPGMIAVDKVPLKDGVEMGFEKLVHNKEDNVKILLQIDA